MNFEEKKEKIINCAEVAYGYIDDDEYDDAQGLITSILDLVKQLKPDYPTCSTCAKYNRLYNNAGSCKDEVGSHWIINENEYTPLVDENFGCNQHSGLESKDETN